MFSTHKTHLRAPLSQLARKCQAPHQVTATNVSATVNTNDYRCRAHASKSYCLPNLEKRLEGFAHQQLFELSADRGLQ